MGYLVNTQVKNFAKSKNLDLTADFADEADKKVLALFEEAAKRAVANGRKTLMPRDL
jgi:histone H3/H4